MEIKKSLKNIFNSVVGNLAVIGPHADIEAELLLAGKKPLGWLAVFSHDETMRDPDMQAEYEGVKKLDEAVRQGKLKSMDVIWHKDRKNSMDLDSELIELPHPLVFRHYCQPGKEEDMKLLAKYNEKAFNFEETDDSLLKKDIGTYLGYRDKDVKLWQNGRWPEKLLRFSFRFVHSKECGDKLIHILNKVNDKWFYLIQPRAQKAYQQKLLHQIEKEQKKAAGNQPKAG